MPKYNEWTTPDGLLRVEGLARDGLTDEQIAARMGICRDTLSEWKKRFPGISDALKSGKAPVDYTVENALLKRAKGYEYDETKITAAGEKVVVKKIMPPDVTACIFWLKNRRPDKWRDKPEMTEQGNDLLQSLYEIMKER